MENFVNTVNTLKAISVSANSKKGVFTGLICGEIITADWLVSKIFNDTLICVKFHIFNADIQFTIRTAYRNNVYVNDIVDIINLKAIKNIKCDGTLQHVLNDILNVLTLLIDLQSLQNFRDVLLKTLSIKTLIQLYNDGFISCHMKPSIMNIDSFYIKYKTYEF